MKLSTYREKRKPTLSSTYLKKNSCEFFTIQQTDKQLIFIDRAEPLSFSADVLCKNKLI